MADLEAYGVSLKSHTPVDPRTPVVGSFVAGTTRVAQIFPIQCNKERIPLPEKLADHADSNTSDLPGYRCCFPDRNTADYTCRRLAYANPHAYPVIAPNPTS